MKGRLTFVVFGLTALGAAGWLGWSLFGPATGEGTGERLRYVNISIALPPEDSGLRAHPDYAAPENSEVPGGGPVVVIGGTEPDAYLLLDALTGEVLVDKIGPTHRDAADAILASVRQEREPPQLWPLAGVAPTGERVTFGRISFIEPDPGSGVYVALGEGDGPQGNETFLFIHNGRSRMTLSESGETNMALVLAEDREVFQRVASVVVVAEGR